MLGTQAGRKTGCADSVLFKNSGFHFVDSRRRDRDEFAIAVVLDKASHVERAEDLAFEHRLVRVFYPGEEVFSENRCFLVRVAEEELGL